MLSLDQFPLLNDYEDDTGPGATYLGSSTLTPETLKKVADAVETKTRGQKAAETRRKNREAKAKEQAEKESGGSAEAGFYPPVTPVSLQSNNGFPFVAGTGHAQGATGEVDPSGKDAHEAGAKLDAGKVDMAVILASFPRALFAVGSVGQFGAAKYSLDGWLEVAEGVHRYTAADIRHLLKQFIEGPIDTDSKLHHMAHEAWNSLAKLELYCREHELTGEFKVAGHE